ncbi:MAG TPA: S53 family peptidase [Kofleriaceae bacterium]|nr:S53 family peptidase [Kofleriaceae bacterium]
MRLSVTLALFTFTSACAVDADISRTTDELGVEAVDVCTDGEFRCLAKALEPGELRAAPRGYGAADLADAYAIPTAGDDQPTIAIVVAYGDSRLEADLAKYRTQYGLPPCTIANGCLRVVNQRGDTSPLPADPPTTNDWTLETMLDLDMASAGCPRCRLLVVQADDTGNGLLAAQHTAVALGADVISNSWGRPEKAGQSLAAAETFLDQPGVAIFAAAGDSGFNSSGAGPSYPGTSQHVIAIGGTRLERASNARGWRETAWTEGGSACSLSIAKPAYQTASPCVHRASSDLAAVADPATGVAVYHAGGWKVLGGTSASAPLVAAIFAATGQAQQTAASIATQPALFHDVVAGANGACGDALCTAGTGWDGPTGFGTPDGERLRDATLAPEPPSDEPMPIDPPADDPGSASEDPVAGCRASSSSSWLAVLAVLGVVALRRRRTREVANGAVSSGQRVLGHARHRE